MRFLLRPSWLALIGAVLGFVVLCYTLLAPWQFGRETQREAEQQAIDASYQAAPVPLADLVPAGDGVTDDLEWSQVTVTGTYLPEAQALVRLRVVDGKPAYEVLTPLRTDDGRLVAIDRGFVTAEGGATVPDIVAAPAGPVTLTGRLRVDETDPQGRGVVDIGGRRQLYAADSRPLAISTGLALEAGYVQLSPGQPGVLSPLAVAPGTGGAPFTNLSYALQWLTFGAIALFALAYFVRLEVLQRRGAREDRSALRRALAGDDPAPDNPVPDNRAPDDPAPGDPAPDRGPTPNPGETPLADRYGR